MSRAARPSSGSAPAAVLLATPWLAVACTGVLGIDQEYRVEESAIGGRAASDSGGPPPGGAAVAGAGAAPVGGGPAGGAPSGGGGTGGGGTGGNGVTPCGASAVGCGAGDKCCNGLCIPQATDTPLTGCGTRECRCPAPPDQGVAECAPDGSCTIVCNPGFVASASVCEPVPPAGGAGGGGGAPPVTDPPCVADLCGPCSPAGPFQCCRNNNTCGCTWVRGGYCL